jgi:hypothetical protein
MSLRGLVIETHVTVKWGRAQYLVVLFVATIKCGSSCAQDTVHNWAQL